tara:strand:- start:38164 stop:39222 length:1059 start_codon:yes stop_codon:yes gene_type:complete
MTPSTTTKIGIIGYGFMGRTHARAYQDARRDGSPCQLIAIADRNHEHKAATEPAGNIGAPEIEIETTGIAFHNHADAIIRHPDIELVSICTHTETHVELAIAALNAGKHVLLEKPIALKPNEVEHLLDVASKADGLCIPAMCMRFWPAWAHIKQTIDSKAFGRVRNASFSRLGSRPQWSSEFYSDQSRSGGVLHDLHIHDTDFIVHCFGVPTAVTCEGDPMALTTLYHYEDFPSPISAPICASGAWDRPPSMGYQMKCTIVFEDATLDFDLNRPDQLILYQGDQSTPIEIDPRTGYDHQIRWTLDQIAKQKTGRSATAPFSTDLPMQDALVVARVLAAEQLSMEQNQRISIV